MSSLRTSLVTEGVSLIKRKTAILWKLNTGWRRGFHFWGSTMQSRNLLAPLPSEGEEGGAEKGEESGGGLGDVVVADDLDSVDCGSIGHAWDVVGADIEHGGSEAGVTDVVAGKADLAVEVGVEAKYAIAGGAFVVGVVGDAGGVEVDLVHRAACTGVAVNVDVVVSPAERGEIDAGDAEVGGVDARAAHPAHEVAIHHDLVVGGARVADGVAVRSGPENVHGVGGEVVGVGDEAGIAGGNSPGIGGNDAGDIGSREAGGLEVAEEID